MRAPKCQYCGSSETIKSPSGRHLLCAGCNRMLMQPRPHKRTFEGRKTKPTRSGTETNPTPGPKKVE